MDDMPPVIVDRDHLGSFLDSEVLTADHYVVSRDATGRVLLEPIVVSNPLEVDLLADPAFRARMTLAATEPAELLDLDSP